MPRDRSPDSPAATSTLRAFKIGARCRGALLVLLACAFSWCPRAPAAPAPEVLILISRNPTDAWAVAELDGMQRILGAAQPPVSFVAEYMDTPGQPTADYWTDITEYYRSKFPRDQFRVILAADAPALDFLLKHRDELFPTAQVAFCGITKFDDQIRKAHPWVTGVIENPDPSACFRLALALQPDLERLIILDDSTQGGRGNLLRIQREMPEEASRVRLELLRADTARELFAGVERLPPRSAVLMTRATVARRMGPELLARCPVPIYGQRSPTHLTSIVAGAVIDGEWHGEAAARLGLRLLAGEAAADIPVTADVPTRFVADYRQMQRFSLPFAALPPETEIVNRPRSVWEQYPLATRVAAGALASLSIVACWLAWALLQNRRKALALKSSFSLLNATLDASTDGVLVVDLRGRVAWFNRRFVELWRIPPEMAQRRDDAALLDFVLDQVKEPAAFLHRVKQLYATPEAESLDLIEFNDTRVFERRSRPQWIDDEIVGRVWTFADITARRAAEDANRQLEARLAHSHRLEALGTLAGGIAHDFNNLLAAILGYAQLAQASLAPGDPARADIDAILAGGERARDLVQQILTFSRKSPFERRLIELGPVVRDAIRLLRPTVSAAIEIRTEIEEPTGVVLADSSQVHQAVLNLATNAAQAMHSHPGTVTIRLEQGLPAGSVAAEHPALAGVRCACVIVRDTGPGIDAETLRRVFDPFFTTKAPGEGTGLGLAVVHGIMQNHDGAVTIESELGAGTTVKLYFPLVDAAAETTPAPAEIPNAGGRRVLVVDDEASVLRVAELLLRRQGYDVTACRRPEAALETLRTSPGRFEALVTDLNMPRMTGIDLALKSREADPEIAIVLATGFLGDPALERDATDAGISEIIGKPYTIAALHTAVQRALALAQSRRDHAVANPA